MASIADTERRMRELRAEMRRTEQQIAAQASAVTEQNQQALRRLHDQTARDMSQWQGQLEAQYGGMLQLSVDTMQTQLRTAHEQMQQEYQRLRAEQLAALAEERQKQQETAESLEALRAALEQERAYFQETAERVCTETAVQLRDQLSGNPVAWFFPQHAALYRETLRTAQDYARQGFYQTAIAIAETLSLRMQTDLILTQREFMRWLNYFSVYISALLTEHRLLWETCPDIPGQSPEFYERLGLLSHRLTQEQADMLSGGRLAPLMQQHNAEYGITETLRAAGVLDDSGELHTDRLLQYMQEHPEGAASLDAVSLYNRAEHITARLGTVTAIAAEIRSRLVCADQRIRLCEMLMQTLRDDYGFDGDEPTAEYADPEAEYGAIVIGMTDLPGDISIEIQIIPLRQEATGSWYNCIGFLLRGDYIDGLRAELSQFFEAVSADNGIPVDRSQAPADATEAQRRALYANQFRVRLNGHAE